MTEIYWYAPFNNAGELMLAETYASRFSDHILVHVIGSRFGEEMPRARPGRLRIVDGLPAPAGEQGGSRSLMRRAAVALRRAILRERQLRAHPADVVHLHTFNPVTDWWAIPRLRRSGALIVASIHNVRPHDRKAPEPLQAAALRRGYLACDVLIVAHDVLRDELASMGVPADRIHVVGLPLMTARLEVKPSNVRDDEVVVLFFGTFRQNKGIDVLIEAIQALPLTDPELPRLSFYFAGRGDAVLEAAVRQLASSDPRVSAEIGYISDARRRSLFETADIVVLPYTSISAQSGVLNDAYASARPVIATDVGPIGASVRQHGSGIVVGPADAQELARAVRALATDSHARMVLASGAHRAAGDIDAGEIVDGFRRLYALSATDGLRSSQHFAGPPWRTPRRNRST